MTHRLGLALNIYLGPTQVMNVSLFKRLCSPVFRAHLLSLIPTTPEECTSHFTDLTTPNISFQEIFQKEVDSKPGIGTVDREPTNLREDMRSSPQTQEAQSLSLFLILPLNLLSSIPLLLPMDS